MNDKKKVAVIVPVLVLLAIIAIIVLLVVGKDVIMETLASISSEQMNIICFVLTILGLVALYLSLKHVDVKKKK